MPQPSLGCLDRPRNRPRAVPPPRRVCALPAANTPATPTRRYRTPRPTGCADFSERLDRTLPTGRTGSSITGPSAAPSPVSRFERHAGVQCFDASSFCRASGSTKYRSNPQSAQTTARIFADENVRPASLGRSSPPIVVVSTARSLHDSWLLTSMSGPVRES